MARVPFIWEAVEPEPGRYDDVYIARVLRLQLLHVSTAVPGATLRPEALSRIFVPRRMYPNGYVVRASNAQVNSRKNARVLMLSAGQHKSVSVTVAPAGG